MYAQYFGLKQPPFSIAPDPRYLFMSERHREALAHLLYGIGGGGGFVVLTGEVGAGKTTVCRCLLEQIPERCNVAYIFNPKLTVEEMLRSVCAEFRIPYRHEGSGTATVKDYVDALNEFLLRTHAVGQNNVLIIDEAQNLSADVLEQLRLLTNLETSERKLLQIVLIGQPELRAILAQPGMQQLAQRVIARYHLDALAESETAHYVRHRLTVAGMTRALPFDRRSLRRIYRHSRGIPRRINLLCDRALLGTYASGRSTVDARTVDKAAQEVFDQPATGNGRAGYERAGLLGLAVVAGVALVATITFALDRGAREKPAAASAAKVALAAAPKPSAPMAATASATAIAATATPPIAKPASAAPTTEADFELGTGFASLVGTEAATWRDLARAWNIDAGDGDPCVAARSKKIQCFRTGKATLALIRQLDRPGVLTLRDGDNRAAYALLVGLSKNGATLRINGTDRTVSLLSLADYWRGEFATFWRTPPDYSGTIVDSRSGPSARWLALQLATARGDPGPVGERFDEGALKGWIHSFQLTQGLPSDGIAGPITLMRLNRVIGVDEPRLKAEG